MKLKCNFRWLEVTRQYRNWDDRDKEYVETSYTDDPILQYFDQKKNKWVDVPTAKETRKH